MRTGGDLAIRLDFALRASPAPGRDVRFGVGTQPFSYLTMTERVLFYK